MKIIDRSISRCFLLHKAIWNYFDDGFLKMIIFAFFEKIKIEKYHFRIFVKVNED